MQRPANRPIERGALVRHFGGPWVAYGLGIGGDFEARRSFEEQPSRAQLSAVPWS